MKGCQELIKTCKQTKWYRFIITSVEKRNYNPTKIFLQDYFYIQIIDLIAFYKNILSLF